MNWLRLSLFLCVWGSLQAQPQVEAQSGPQPNSQVSGLSGSSSGTIAGDTYRRPGGADTYLRPTGDNYLRP